MQAYMPAHAQVLFIVQAGGTSMQRIVTASCASVRTQMFCCGSHAEQSFTVRHDEGFTQCPDQHAPEMEGTSPGGHAGGIESHATIVGSHSFASAQNPSKHRTPLTPATWQGLWRH
jgi:hypothetical protein